MSRASFHTGYHHMVSIRRDKHKDTLAGGRMGSMVAVAHHYRTIVLPECLAAVPGTRGFQKNCHTRLRVAKQAARSSDAACSCYRIAESARHSPMTQPLDQETGSCWQSFPLGNG